MVKKKYLGINLTKSLLILDTKIYQIFLRKIKENKYK